MQPWPVIGIGVNCTAPEHVSAIVRRLAESLQGRELSIALIAYPNSGEEWDAHGRKWVAGTGHRGDRGARRFSEMAGEWRAAGAQVIGGCCRTTPGHVREVTKALSGGLQ